jgi:hypothetical protein
MHKGNLGGIQTSTKIHEAKEIDPETPDNASWAERWSIALGDFSDSYASI